MNSSKRREDIIKILINSQRPLKGVFLADKYNVTRQVIVKDIAILRARGEQIIATPEGYIIGNNNNNKVRCIVAVSHNEESMIDELNIVVKYGGIIEDVIVEHPLYGEIKGMMMIKNLNDLEKFINRYKNSSAKLLSMLTDGVHIHTIAADSQDDINLIINELDSKGFLIK